jgi:hypothetical protein
MPCCVGSHLEAIIDHIKSPCLDPLSPHSPSAPHTRLAPPLRPKSTAATACPSLSYLHFQAMDYTEWPFRPRPSNAGPDHCMRKLGYQMYDAPHKDPHGRFLVVMDDSSWHEELVIQWLEKSVLQVHSRQLKVQCATTRWNHRDLTINNAIDGIVTDILNGDRLIEIKGIEHFTFTRYAEGETFPTYYLTQVALYIRGVQKLNPTLNEALLLLRIKIRARSSSTGFATTRPRTASQSSRSPIPTAPHQRHF